MSSLRIRKIQPLDNPAIAKVIREVMTSYDCVGCGYSIQDAEVDAMYEAYNNSRSTYYVIEKAGKILGGGGIGPLVGGIEDTCELKKMYFQPELRGHGLGRQMMDLLLRDAKALGYRICYLETVERMHRANVLYSKYGFKKLNAQQGGTGHSGCDTFYSKQL